MNRITEVIYRIRDEVRGRLRKISASYKENAKIAEESGDKIDVSNKRLGGSFAGITSKLTAMRIAVLGVAGVIAGLVAGLAKATKFSQAQEAAEAKLEQAFRLTTGAIREEIQALKDQAAELQKTTRFSDQQTIQAQATLASYRLTAQQIQLLIPSLQDLAEKTRKAGQEQADLVGIAEAVGKAFRDGKDPLEQYGVSLGKRAEEAFKFGSQQEKVEIITKKLSAQLSGEATKAADDYAGGISKATNAFTNLIEKFGAFVTENEGVQRLINGIASAFNTLADVIEKDGGAIGRTLSITSDLIRTFGSVARVAFNTVTIAVKSLAIAFLAQFKIITEASAKLLFLFDDTSEKFQKISDGISGKITELSTSIGTDFEDIKEALDDGRSSFSDLLETGLGPTDELAQEVTGLAAAHDAAAVAARDNAAAEAEFAANAEKGAAAAKALGLDISELTTGISQTAKDAIAAFDDLAKSGIDSSEVLQAAIGAVTTKLDSVEEIESFKASLESAMDTGVLKSEDLSAAVTELSSKIVALEGASKEALQANLDNLEAQRALVQLQIEAIKEAGKEGTEEFAKLTAKLNDLQSSIKETTGQIEKSTQKVVENTKEVGKEFEETGEKARRSGRVTTKALEEVNEIIGETKASVTGIGTAVADALGTFRNLGAGVTVEVDQIVDRVSLYGRSVGKFLSELSSELTTLQDNIASQSQAAEKLLKDYENGVDGADRAIRGAIQSMKLLDNETLDRMRAAIDDAKRRMDEFTKSAQESLERTIDELLRLEGKEDEIESRRLAKRKRDLETSLQFARDSRNREAEQIILEEIRKLDEIARLNDQARRDEEKKAFEFRKKQEQQAPAPSQPTQQRPQLTPNVAGSSGVVKIDQIILVGDDQKSKTALARLMDKELQKIYRRRL